MFSPSLDLQGRTHGINQNYLKITFQLFKYKLINILAIIKKTVYYILFNTSLDIIFSNALNQRVDQTVLNLIIPLCKVLSFLSVVKDLANR